MSAEETRPLVYEDAEMLDQERRVRRRRAVVGGALTVCLALAVCLAVVLPLSASRGGARSEVGPACRCRLTVSSSRRVV